MSTIRTLKTMDNYEPKRNSQDLIEPSEYQQLLNKTIPNLKVEVTRFDKQENRAVTKEENLHDLLAKDEFLMAWQPGASTKEEADKLRYSSLPGAPGCSGELFGSDEVCPQLMGLGLKNVLVCSGKTSQQQRQVFADRDKELVNKQVKFISDPNFVLAKALGLFIREDKEKNIKFVERINIFGNNLQINKYICAAQMDDPKAPKQNATNLPTFVKQAMESVKQKDENTEMKVEQISHSNSEPTRNYDLRSGPGNSR